MNTYIKMKPTQEQQKGEMAMIAFLYQNDQHDTKSRVTLIHTSAKLTACEHTYTDITALMDQAMKYYIHGSQVKCFWVLTMHCQCRRHIRQHLNFATPVFSSKVSSVHLA